MSLLQFILTSESAEDTQGPQVIGNATVSNANPNQFVINFNEPINISDLSGITFGGDWETPSSGPAKEIVQDFESLALGATIPDGWKYSGSQETGVREREVVNITPPSIHPEFTGKTKAMRFFLANPQTLQIPSYSSTNSRVEFTVNFGENGADFSPDGFRQDHEWDKEYEVEWTQFHQTMAPNGVGRTAYFMQMHNADNGIESRFSLGSVSNVSDLGGISANLYDVYQVTSSGSYYQYRNVQTNVQAGESVANGLGWVLMSDKPSGSSPIIGLNVTNGGQVEFIPNGAESLRTNLDVSVFGADMLGVWSRWKIKFRPNPIADWRPPNTQDSYVEVYHRIGTSTTVGPIIESSHLVHTWVGDNDTNPSNWEGAALGWYEHPAPGYWKTWGEYNTSFQAGRESDASALDSAGYTESITYLGEWTIREL